MALDVLSRYEADVYYLVGDIIDGWRLREGWRWTEAHSAIVRHFLERARAGARVVYIPGNHDEFARAFVGRTLRGRRDRRRRGPCHAQRQALSRSPTATRSTSSSSARRRSRCSATAAIGWRSSATPLSTPLTRRLGLPYWSFSAWIKLKIKTAVNAIGDFERQLAAEARRRGVDGVICGHIHHPTMRDIDGVTYINIGDFVESCSLVIEREDGVLTPLRWHARERAAGAPRLRAVEVGTKSAG